MKKPKRYPDPAVERIEAQIPPSIKRAMKENGWNALGIYELVQRELAAEKKKAVPS